MKYRILFIGYWNLDDPLTESTIIPHLKILKTIDSIAQVSFTNTQREIPSNACQEFLLQSDIPYFPLYSKNLKPNLFNKVLDFIEFPKQIQRLLRSGNYNYIIARGAPAGALAYLSTKTLKIPYIVESFEPHADYMYYSSTWKKYDPRYMFQKYWEQKQKMTAQALLTVSHNYKAALEKEGIEPQKILVAPCAVDTEKFYWSEDKKSIMRKKLLISLSANVGVYAGKFGGIYLEDEAFKIFKACFTSIEDFHLLLMNNQNKEWLKVKFRQFGLPQKKITQLFVTHSDMSSYLNAADFGFALYKTSKVSSYLSPVKVGEYWACGLPILMTKNIGDEQDFIEKEEMGLIYNNQTKKSLSQLCKFDPQSIQKKAEKFRNFSQIKKCYNQLLN